MPFNLQKVVRKHKGRVYEKWIFDAHSPLLSNAAIADIDGDGILEVVFGTKEGVVHCLDHDARPKWIFKTGEDVGKGKGEEYFYNLETLHEISASPALVDFNHNGKKEVIIGTQQGLLYALSATGEQLWERKVGGAIRATPLVVDFNNDGAMEIIVTTGERLVVLNTRGEEIVSYKSKSPLTGRPAVLRGSGGKQSIIIVGNEEGEVIAIDTQERELWKFKTGAKITAEPVLHKQLILVASWDGNLYALRHDGSLVWRFKTQGAIYNKPVVADVNGDGAMEIVVGSCDNNIYTINMKGERLWSYETDFWIVASPLAIDLDQDGNVEVVAGSYDNNIYVLEGAGSYELDYVPGLSGVIHQSGHYADVLSSEPGQRQGKRLWQYRTKGMVVGCALLEEPGEHPRIVVNVKSGFVNTLTQG